MKKTIAALCAAGVVLATLGTVPASAASLQTYGGQIQNAQFQFGFGVDDGRGDRDRYDRRDERRDDRRFERRGNSYYYNGQRGYRDRRAGYRQFNGFWFPQSAFSFSVTIDADRDRGRGFRLSESHYAWCEDRYVSYRISDNSFQPFNGSRRECVSPFS